MKDVADFCFNGGKVVVTCGPGYEPVDEVRRLTNHSTGRLGTELSRALLAGGVEVICLRGILSTWTKDVPGLDLRTFTTAGDLEGQLGALGESGQVGAIFHAAALSDFRVKEISDATGRLMEGRKISSRLGELHVTLETAPKVIRSFRARFSNALLVGWKYELDGTSEDVLQAGLRQMAENHTDACVLNGTAYGPGFGICEKGLPLHHCQNEDELFAYWIDRLQKA